MPITFSRGNVRKLAFRSRGRSVQSLDIGGPRVETPQSGDDRLFLQIKPALADPRAAHPAIQRSSTILTGNDYGNKGDGKDDVLNLQAVGEGKVQLSRTPQEKDRLPDRISLDRRGLSSIPNIVGEPTLRLLSLQHNLINSLSGLMPLELGKLVFLDVYDNQIDKITSLEKLFSLRVLLMGKNRIKRIEGLSNLVKLEVLDLHGNRITKVNGLSNLNELKVLNLAGNQIKCIGQIDLQGLVSLRELNLKRNKLRKLLGFQKVPQLQKLFLSNNDLQSVEDVSSLAEAMSLVEVTLDGNPVALGGDCTPFLVSYLPNLLTLSSMHVTDQVRAAAMAWRNNKEAAHAAYCALGGSAQQAARRDQIIHNARTNWELLRTENKCFNAAASLEKNIEKEFVLEQSSITITQNDSTQTMDATTETAVTLNQETEDSDSKNNISDASTKNVKDEDVKKTQVRKFQRSSTARKVIEKRVNFSDRSASQDTDVSHSTSTSSDVRLPPILLPIISSLENVKLSDGTESILKRWESVSSVDPIIDSSFSSFPSSSSESEDETNKKPLKRMPTVMRNRQNFISSRSKSVCDPESRKVKAKIQDQVENTSNLSCSTNAGSINTSSTSGSDQNSRTLRRDGSLNSRISNRNVRSATISRRSERASSGHRASTARAKSGKSLASLKSSEPVPKSMPPSKDREQGVDYLVEVCEGTVSAWGAGAVRRLARDWDWERARAVTRAAFHYVHFNAVAQSLSELKTRFPNITHISVRATGLQYLGQLHALAELRGITGLTIMPEGNPICSKYWREYSIYRLAHWGLKEINDEKVTEEELKSANRTYQGLSDIVLRAIPDAPLQPLLSRLGRNSNSTSSAKAWLRAADPALRDVIAKEALQFKKGQVSQEDMSWRVRGRGQLSHAIEVACGAAQRLRTLELQWPTIFVEMIEDILHDFVDMDKHVKEQMRTLSDS
ncbi:PREDICTED: leucine-rich repeat-containing protein 49 [Papilio xuthus]|uniref:Leucine-rich repeat-containing protein 49 n=1 Tax=Papilio xuthus TaxID=66420 RepID=A0AAJ6Z169_PAPXU|nr:PREDICTED: leucine-rich repeat-containing protein 49 [Papilio xuthus]XP_013162952.1 PREDICTED: leucine-rich repeat-containing protein 49 [Papilio xuthus]